MIANASEYFAIAWSATVASSAAILIVVAIRRPLRRIFGANAAYVAWTLLPAALLGSLLPPPTIEQAGVASAPIRAVFAPAASALAQTPEDSTWLWLMLWAFGIATTALYFLRQQRNFVVALGKLRDIGNGVWRADARHGLPALIGIVPPRIVVPVDFESRYDDVERRLMLDHERTHLRRGDPVANLAFAVLRTLFWFNPLLHVAAAKFRDDQEFACDQTVIAASPQSRRAYGDAMLKTLVAAQPVPLGCHWGLAHPLKERLVQLRTHVPHRAMRALGATLALALAAGTAFAVWSAQTPRSVASDALAPGEALGDIRIDIAASINGGEVARFAMHTTNGVPFAFAHQDGDRVFDVRATVDRTSAGLYDLRASIKQNGKRLAEPRLITASGKPAVIRIGDEKPGRDANATRFEGIEIDFIIGPALASAKAHAAVLPAPPQPPAPPVPPLSVLAPEPPLSVPLPPNPPLPPLAPELPPLSVPAPPDPPAPPSLEVSRVSSAQAATSAKAHAIKAQVAQAAALEAHKAAAAQAANAQTSHEAALSAAVAAEVAQDAARAAEAAAVAADPRTAERAAVRAKTMAAEQRTAREDAHLERIAMRRAQLRAMATAGETTKPVPAALPKPVPATPVPTPH